MNETPPPPSAPSAQVLLRYSVLAQVEALLLAGRPVMEAVREVAGREHADPDGSPVRVSVRTIQRWRAAYRAGGLAGLPADGSGDPGAPEPAGGGHAAVAVPTPDAVRPL